LADATAHYQRSLRSSRIAVDYLNSRGISGRAASRFALGYATPAWNGLASVLYDYDLNTVQASGLQAFKAGAQSRPFDRFRDRIMFPVRDMTGAVAGFGARVIRTVPDQVQPKYLNSPEGPLFQKRDLLYGLFEAQDAIREEGIAFVVEGFLDVVSLNQAGVLTSVATMGTAFTPEHAASLLSITSRVVFCFDGDAAGLRAASHAADIVLPLATDNNRFEFLFLPTGHDPDSFIRTFGAQAFRDLLPSALSLPAFLKHHVFAVCKVSCLEDRALCVCKAKVLWSILPAGWVRDDLVSFCSEISFLTADELIALWGGGMPASQSVPQTV
jgi:DNA primase